MQLTLYDYYCEVVQFNAISNPKPFSEKQKQYKNEKIIKSIQTIKQHYESYREVRGDGNCFYRAVIVSYIQNNLQNNNWKQIPLWINVEVLDKPSIPQPFLQFYNNEVLRNICFQGLVWILQEHRYLKTTGNTLKKDYLSHLLNHYPLFDFCLVVATRCQAANTFIQSHQKQPLKHFIIGNELENIIEYGCQAENTVINVTASALNCRLRIISLQVDQVQTYDINSEQQPQCLIHLFYRKGHYDLCYVRNNLPKLVQDLQIADTGHKIQQCHCKSLSSNLSQRKGDCRICQRNSYLTNGICITCSAKATKYNCKVNISEFKCLECKQTKDFIFISQMNSGVNYCNICFASSKDNKKCRIF